ncbi:MAG TPA: AMP-binding protein, partial [Mycobacterium sp.]|uniref:AMP-binding protein n=1 Tax=Mycobacterium sp. TaxID=1785 RepID=UPI002F41D753
MSSETQEDQKRRAAELAANDPEFAAARPDAAVAAAIEAAGTRFPQVTKAVLEGYSDRPALAQRAYELVKDPQTGRTSAKLMPWFSHVTYGELAHRVSELSRALADGLVSAGDRVTVLGFTSVDYTTIDVALGVVGAVSVPLQTSAAIAQLKPIVLETEPTVFAASVDYLSDAVDVIVAAAEAGHTPGRLVVFDYRSELDDNREALQSAHERLADLSLTIETLNEARERGAKLPATTVEAVEDDPLALLIYTSGSTGAPKGAMYPQSNIAKMWNRSTKNWFGPSAASITLNFMPMSHVMGRGTLYGTLGNGGTAYFAAKSDLSTLLEDLRLVRPTELNFVPRIWEMLHSEYQSEVGRRTGEGADRQAAESQVLSELRHEQLGGRFIFAMTGSAPTSPELRSWVESLLQMHLVDGYGSTEAGMVLLDGEIQRPPVIDYKLVDVPDLGYFATDRPYPRGELLLKTPNMFPGYYKRPETTAGVFDDDGYYRTGDVFAETAPDRLVYVDRRNNVLKLAQGEFVTLAKLEAEFGNSPLIHQIYIYGNSAQPYLLAVVVPSEDALAAHDPEALKPRIAESLQTVARLAKLQSYEVPRDFIIETTPFSLENGLLTGIRKLA